MSARAVCSLEMARGHLMAAHKYLSGAKSETDSSDISFWASDLAEEVRNALDTADYLLKCELEAEQ